MALNGRTVIILVLMGFWIYVAFSAYRHGDATRAMVYLVVGAALTVWRFSRARA